LSFFNSHLIVKSPSKVKPASLIMAEDDEERKTGTAPEMTAIIPKMKNESQFCCSLSTLQRVKKKVKSSLSNNNERSEITLTFPMLFEMFRYATVDATHFS